MENKTRLLRNRIIVIFIAISFLVGCSLLIGFENFLKSVLFVSVGLAFSIGGTLFVVWRFGEKQHLAFIILAGWYGFSFALMSLLGMGIDPRSAGFSWTYSLKVAGIVGIGTFLFMILMMPIGLAALRFWRKNFGNPVSPRR
jgi:hypothetical protein